MKIVRLVVNLLIFILLLVLALDNIQTVTINLYNLYTFQIPLIIAMVIFVILGMIIGILFSLGSNLKLRTQIYNLKRKLEKEQNSSKNKSDIDQVI